MVRRFPRVYMLGAAQDSDQFQLRNKSAREPQTAAKSIEEVDAVVGEPGRTSTCPPKEIKIDILVNVNACRHHSPQVRRVRGRDRTCSRKGSPAWRSSSPRRRSVFFRVALRLVRSPPKALVNLKMLYERRLAGFEGKVILTAT